MLNEELLGLNFIEAFEKYGTSDVSEPSLCYLSVIECLLRTNSEPKDTPNISNVENFHQTNSSENSMTILCYHPYSSDFAFENS
jgi:hypothetical protein